MKSIHDVRIREFRQADLMGVVKLISHTIDTCYSGIYPPRAVQFFREYHCKEKIMRRHINGDILVLEEHGAMVATGTRVAGEIFGVFVHPQFQHRGYGRALMLELESRAKTAGLIELELSVSLPSRGFYESLGYKMLRKCSDEVGDGQNLDYWNARKLLTSKRE